MPDYLAFDWEQHQVFGLDAQVAPRRVRLKGAVRIAFPQGATPTDAPKVAGQRLREELDRHGITSKLVLISVPRQDAVVRRLELPNVGDDELPDLVRFQAVTKLATPLDQLLLDFVPLPSGGTAAGREVLMVSIPRSLADRIRATLEAAGLELRSIGLSSFGAAELAVRAEQQLGDAVAGSSLVVGRQDDRLEIVIVQDGRLIFSHATQLPGDDEERAERLVLTEIQRSMVARQPTAGAGEIARIWLTGTDEENASLLARIRERFPACAVQNLDPLQCAEADFDQSQVPDSHVAFAGPFGLLATAGGGIVAGIDFLNPRRKIVKPDRRRLKAGLAAAGVLVALGTAYGMLQLRLSDLDRRIRTTKTEIRDLDQILKAGEPMMAASQAVGNWEGSQAEWLDRIRDFNRLLPGTERLYLTDLRVSPASIPATARLQATGLAKERGDVEALYQRLADAQYRVQPQRMTANRQDGDYPFRFELDMQFSLTPEPDPEAVVAQFGGSQP